MAPSLPASPKWRAVLSFARRGLISLAVAGICVTLMRGQHPNFAKMLVYTLSITLGCWFFIDAGRILLGRWVWRHERQDARFGTWPGWLGMAGILVVGTALGYAFGASVGNWITGWQAPGLFGAGGWRQTLAVIGVSLVPGVAATYFFYSRERLAVIEAQAQTAQRQAAENQLKLLESQLEPHMLFNTLANLRVLIGLDPLRAQAMLDRLIAFLRATLAASRTGSHPLATEFARLGDYLELMKVRMGERLQPRLELPEALASQPVPPLLLQPLVENAIKHGLEPHVGGGELVVSAAREGDTLVLRVRDSGRGLQDVGAAGGSGFGLQQVRERLATLHGGAASLALAPADGGGTVATVRLPLVHTAAP